MRRDVHLMEVDRMTRRLIYIRNHSDFVAKRAGEKVPQNEYTIGFIVEPFNMEKTYCLPE